jgi:predicted DNA-binding ribbon-helix-helix protein
MAHALQSSEFRSGGVPAGGLARIPQTVTVCGKPVVLRMEVALWDALNEICEREGLAVDDLCTRVYQRRRANSLAACLRGFIISYLRTAVAQSRGFGFAEAGSTFSADFRKAIDIAVPLDE